MNIVHLVTTDDGGAARAAIRISNSLNTINNENINSKIFVAKKKGSDINVENLISNKKEKFKLIGSSIINNKTISKFKTSSLFSNDKLGINITKYEAIKNADIINLHWINQGMLSYKSLEELKKLGKPIVWTLHDMCPFTGGCHYDENCGKYKEKCGQCKVLGSKKVNDLSTKIQRRKKEIFKDMNLTIIGCSSWITQCAKESQIFKNKKCINIPNSIDIEKFKPIEKNFAKEILNINLNKRVILFGAMSSISNSRKGFKYLLESLKILDKEKYIAVIFGNNNKVAEIDECLETVYLGQLSDDISLSLVYSIADVFVAPSEQENLSNAVMEALSCGTPVVAFNIGGMSDMIKHKKNGYLAIPFESDDLSKGIEWCVDNNDELKNNARKFVIDNYRYEIVSEKYKLLYRSLL